MLLWVPSSQSHAALSRLILQVLRQNIAGPRIGNVIGIIIFIEQMTIVFVAMLVVSRDVIIVGVVSLQMILLGLCDQSD